MWVVSAAVAQEAAFVRLSAPEARARSFASLPGTGHPNHALDGNVSTAWIPGDADPGAWMAWSTTPVAAVHEVKLRLRSGASAGVLPEAFTLALLDRGVGVHEERFHPRPGPGWQEFVADPTADVAFDEVRLTLGPAAPGAADVGVGDVELWVRADGAVSGPVERAKALALAAWVGAHAAGAAPSFRRRDLPPPDPGALAADLDRAMRRADELLPVGWATFDCFAPEAAEAPDACPLPPAVRAAVDAPGTWWRVEGSRVPLAPGLELPADLRRWLAPDLALAASPYRWWVRWAEVEPGAEFDQRENLTNARVGFGPDGVPEVAVFRHLRTRIARSTDLGREDWVVFFDPAGRPASFAGRWFVTEEGCDRVFYRQHLALERAADGTVAAVTVREEALCKNVQEETGRCGVARWSDDPDRDAACPDRLDTRAWRFEAGP